jgi:hypothetical protein
VGFYQNSFQNRFWQKKFGKSQKKMKNFWVWFFAKLLSFEFCQKFFFGRQKIFKNLFQNCFEIVFENFAKSGEKFC